MIAWTVFCKELRDALRDRRTLVAVCLSSVALGPLLLLALSALVDGIEKRAEQRVLMVAGIAEAPTLANFLQRQTYTLRDAPADYERRLADGRLKEPVLVVGRRFEAELAKGDAPRVLVVYSSADNRAQASVGRVQRLVQAFSSEQATLRLAMRGVAPSVLEVVSTSERDLASAKTRAAQLTGILPFFVVMAVLYGALNAALDTTAGERERGSLEPLLMTPARPLALVVGKWGAVASVGMLIAALSCLGFLPAQALLGSETLAALFEFGWREAGLFLLLLAPLAAAVSALMMAIAIRCRTTKEAQANNTLVVLVVSLLPLVTVLGQGGEAPWHLWVPALGQVTLMNRVLKGDAIGGLDFGAPLLVCVLMAALCIADIARRLRGAAVR